MKKPRRPKALLFRASVFTNAAVPLGMLVWDGAHDRLGVNPIEFITRTTGTLTLVFLLATLGVSSLRRLGFPPVVGKVRRMLGLFTFFYASLHFLTYVWLDKFFHVGDIVADALGRPFIAIGLVAFFLMVPMAVTSTDRWIRKLSGGRWKKIHQRIYFLSFLGVVHAWMVVKVISTRQIMYGLVLAALLGERLIHTLRERARPRGVGADE